MTEAEIRGISYRALGDASELRHRVPLVIGVTGHRDLRNEDIEELKRRVGEVFDDIAKDYLTAHSPTPIIVLSSLAEGADQLVASVALERGAILIAPLPMPLEEYRKDFQFGLTPNALSEFNRLLAHAAAAPEMPLLDGVTIEAVRADARRRAMQYREAGLYIVRHCQILLTLWDGDESDVKTGGTAEIVRRQREGAPLSDAPSVRACIDGTEIGPIVTIVTPRRKSTPGSVKIAAKPWGRALAATASDIDAKLWRDFETRIQLTTSFNADATRLLRSKEGEAKSDQSFDRLFDAPDAPALGASARAYALAEAPLFFSLYTVADVLAQEYQQRFTRVWTWLFSFGFLMVAALSFISNAPSHKIYALCAYQALIVGSLGVYWLARRRRLQAKFLDYRALSEALRVAIFWKIACIDKSVTEIYPICQSPELSWIKNALLSLECFGAEKPSAPRLDDTRYRVCRDLWADGQLHYFRRRGKSHEQVVARRKQLSVAAIGLAAAGTGLVALADYLGFDWRGRAPFNSAVFAPVALAMLPAGAAALKGHAEQLGRTAQALQYDRMRSLYERALSVLPASIDQLGEEAAREVFVELGREALHETTSWTSIFRLRPLRPF
jgi:hypothetical protein